MQAIDNDQSEICAARPAFEYNRRPRGSPALDQQFLILGEKLPTRDVYRQHDTTK